MKQHEMVKRRLIHEVSRWCRSGEQLRRLLLNSCPDTILVVSPGRRIVMTNGSLAPVFGYQAREVIGRKTDLLYEDRRADISARPREIFETLEKDGCHVGTARGRRKDGSPLPLEILTGRLRNCKGAVLLLRDLSRAAALVDSAAGVRTQNWGAPESPGLGPEGSVQARINELERTCEELKKLNRVKDQILSSVSHEFRTPLTSIISFSELLLSYPDNSPETQKEFLSIINSESRRLARLIGDTLDQARIRAGKMAWSFRPTEARPVIRTAVRALGSLLLEKRLRVESRLHPGLPAFPADEDMIVRVLINLLGNAIKYTPEGGRILVTAGLLEGGRTDERGDTVHFAVADDGVGLKPEDLRTLFEPFRQCGNRPDERTQGTGLGLSICKEIIEAHRGKIWAESTPGQGSVFHFTLPAACSRTLSLPLTGDAASQCASAAT